MGSFVIIVDANVAPGSLFRTDPCGALYNLAATYPGETIAVRIGAAYLLIFQDSIAARHVLRSRPENYRKNFGSFVNFFGHSRLTEDGERWRRLQSLSQPLLKSLDLNAFAAATYRAFGKVAEKLAAGASSSVGIPIDQHLNVAAAQIISESILGFQLDELGTTAFDDIRSVLRHSASNTWNMAGSETTVSPERMLEGRNGITRLSSAVNALVQKRRTSATGKGLLGILAAADEGTVDIFGELCTLLFAGFDTSAAAVGWSLWLLAKRPDLQELLRSKIRAAMGSETTPALEHVDQLPELMGFINEALRLFPPIPILSRIAIEKDSINEEPIEAGQRLLISVIGLHLDPRSFADPMKAVIGRYPNGRPTKEQMQGLMPFSMGPRVCGGARLAMVELPIALMTLVSELRFVLPKDDRLQFSWEASMRRRGGHSFIVQKP
jgi:enediyne biosynthesis protein E7